MTKMSVVDSNNNLAKSTDGMEARIADDLGSMLSEVNMWTMRQENKENKENKENRHTLRRPLKSCFMRAQYAFEQRCKPPIRSWALGRHMEDSLSASTGVVLFTTSCGIVRDVADRCRVVRAILTTNLLRHSVRDLFVHTPYKQQLRDLLAIDGGRRDMGEVLPVVYVDGQLFGDFKRIHALNELQVLTLMLREYTMEKNVNVSCELCNGVQFMLCTHCSGSKKSPLNRSLRCRNCNPFGLVPCCRCAGM